MTIFSSARITSASWLRSPPPILPQAYGAYMTPSWISEDGLTFYFVMSQFGPHNTYVVKATLAPR